MFQNETKWMGNPFLMGNQQMRWKTLRKKPKLWYANYTTWEKRIENLFILMYWIYISFSFKWVFNLFDSCVQRWREFTCFYNLCKIFRETKNKTKQRQQMSNWENKNQNKLKRAQLFCGSKKFIEYLYCT